MLKAHAVQCRGGQCNQQLDAPSQIGGCSHYGMAPGLFIALHGYRVVYMPVGRDGLTGPDRALVFSRIVAHR
jgi:hypothetical protein